MFSFTKLAAAAAIASAVALLPAVGSAEIFKGEIAGVGDPVHTMFVTFANQARTADVEIQVNAGQTLTRSMLSGARGEIEFFSSVPSLVGLMANGQRMYESVEDATEVAGNIRSILGFEAGA